MKHTRSTQNTIHGFVILTYVADRGTTGLLAEPTPSGRLNETTSFPISSYFVKNSGSSVFFITTTAVFKNEELDIKTSLFDFPPVAFSIISGRRISSNDPEFKFVPRLR